MVFVAATLQPTLSDSPVLAGAVHPHELVSQVSGQRDRTLRQVQPNAPALCIDGRREKCNLHKYAST